VTRPLLEQRSGPPATTERPPLQVPPPSSTTDSLSHGDDPRRIGELLNDWLAIQMDKVDALVDEADAKVAAIPDQRHLWLLLGETLVRVHCLELEVAELRKGGRR
jgi:hypothetical protein